MPFEPIWHEKFFNGLKVLKLRQWLMPGMRNFTEQKVTIKLFSMMTATYQWFHTFYADYNFYRVEKNTFGFSKSIIEAAAHALNILELRVTTK